MYNLGDVVEFEYEGLHAIGTIFLLRGEMTVIVCNIQPISFDVQPWHLSSSDIERVKQAGIILTSCKGWTVAVRSIIKIVPQVTTKGNKVIKE